MWPVEAGISGGHSRGALTLPGGGGRHTQSGKASWRRRKGAIMYCSGLGPVLSALYPLTQPVLSQPVRETAPSSF